MASRCRCRGSSREGGAGEGADEGVVEGAGLRLGPETEPEVPLLGRVAVRRRGSANGSALEQEIPEGDDLDRAAPRAELVAYVAESPRVEHRLARRLPERSAGAEVAVFAGEAVEDPVNEPGVFGAGRGERRR